MNTPAVEPVAAEIAKAIALCDGGLAAVAASFEVKKQTVYTWANGTRRMPSDHAARLEALAGRKVTRRDMWPLSWARIWPELAETTQHKAAATQEA